MSDLFKQRPARRDPGSLYNTLKEAGKITDNELPRTTDTKRASHNPDLLNYFALKKNSDRVLDAYRSPELVQKKMDVYATAAPQYKKPNKFVYLESQRGFKEFNIAKITPSRIVEVKDEKKEEPKFKKKDPSVLQKQVLDKRAKPEGPPPTGTEQVDKRLKRDTFEKERRQLLRDEEMRRQMLKATPKFNIMTDIEASNQLGANLLEDSADDINDDPTAKLDQFLNYLLHEPFELKITGDEHKTKRLPFSYANYHSYHQKNLAIMLDEVRSQFINKKASDEFIRARAHELEFTFMPSDSSQTILYAVSIPKSVENMQSYQDLFIELDKGAPIIYVKVPNRRTGKKEEFIGIRIKNKGKLKNTNSFVFKFSARFTANNASRFDKFVLSAKYFDDFTSAKRELKALLKIGSCSFNVFHKALNPQVASELRYEPATSVNCSSLSDKLNPSQREAIVNLCDPNRHVGLLQGPPGTGKSFTLIEMVKHILRNDRTDKKILICTPSNCALDELVLRFTKTFNLYNYLDERDPINKRSDVLKVIRIGQCSDNVSEPVLRQAVDNIIRMKYKVGSSKNIVSELREDKDKLNTLLEENTKCMGKDKILSKKIEELTKIIEEKRNLKSYNTSDIKKNMIKEAKVVFSTLNSSAKKQLKIVKDNISYLIVDEATQSTEIQCIVPLTLSPDKMILIGDPCQLPATTFHPLSKQLNLQRSLFERLQELQFKVFMLKIQYRMVPSICKFSSDKFYNSELQSDTTVEDPNYITPKVRSFLDENFNGKSVVFIQVEGETKKRNNSYYNDEEREVIKQYIKKLKNANINDYGIITPYKQQVRNLKDSFYFKYDNDDIMVNTVDGFQGKEKDIIFVSCVKSLSHISRELYSIGFLNDPRRLNVGITRAKFALIVVGNRKTLRQSPLWSDFIKHVTKNEGLMNFNLKTANLKNSIIEVEVNNKDENVLSEKTRTFSGHKLRKKPVSGIKAERPGDKNAESCEDEQENGEVRLHDRSTFKNLLKGKERADNSDKRDKDSKLLTIEVDFN